MVHRPDYVTSLTTSCKLTFNNNKISNFLNQDGHPYDQTTSLDPSLFYPTVLKLLKYESNSATNIWLRCLLISRYCNKWTIYHLAVHLSNFIYSTSLFPLSLKTGRFTYHKVGNLTICHFFLFLFLSNYMKKYVISTILQPRNVKMLLFIVV